MLQRLTAFAANARSGATVPDKQPEDEPKQTTPKGAEIPVPSREDFLRDLRKVAPPPTPPTPRTQTDD